MSKKNEYNLEWIKKYSSAEFENEFTYDGINLGAVYSADNTIFKLWSPFADKVIVNLYQSGDINSSDKIESYEMNKSENGVWDYQVNKDLDGVFYTFTTIFGDEKNEFCDPYAKACGVNGKRAMVVNLLDTNPKGWEEDVNPNEKLSYCESIIYELHVRDLSSDDSSGINNKGKFLGLTENGTTVNKEGKIKTGIDHIKDLGVTHIHLLPFYDYGSIDESKEYDSEKYNWGYDPVNYNVPEGSYSTNAFDGKNRIKELKETIASLHKNGISVVMDVVYNHTYDEEFCFNKAVPGYFHRIDENGVFSNGSICGNDTASERSMVSKYIVDSVLYWAREYHIDGFRFDLVGLLDVDTISKIREGLDKIRPNIILYGEGWSLETKLTKENVDLAVQKNVCKLKDFAMFSDDIRDAMKGHVFDEKVKGFISGNTENVDVLKKSIMGMPDWSTSPRDVINYTSCHDNYTLFDKIRLCNEGISFEDAIKQNLVAISIVMLSQGIPLMNAGEEFLRTKTDNEGNFVGDSYISPDYVNSIKWSNLEKEEYKKVYEFYKGIIAFRKAHKLFQLEDFKEIEEKVSFIDYEDDKVVAYKLKDNKEEIIVILNASEENVKITLDEGKYNVFIKEDIAGNDVLCTLEGEVSVAPVSVTVLVKY
ncbi:MAG: type I pullulanase [Lachnospiraceae bacterium]|nr:type I pullulanase [Lachnospiraceae bacterium]